jgi:long-chain acyl-CoA synthetase
LTPDPCVEYIINHAEIPIIFSTEQHLTTLLRIAPKTPTVKIIVSVDPLEEKTKAVLSAWAKERGIEIWDLPECT